MGRSTIIKQLDRNNMTEETMTQFRTEGEKAFPADKENENSSSSSEGEENKGDQSGSSTEDQNKDVDKGTDEKDAGFLDHPRWKQREEDWKKRFNDQEARHQTDIASIREEFGGARKENAEQTKIPLWFGGDQEQWDAYRADRDAEIKAAEDRAIERVKGEKSAEDKAVKEATDYMQAEITAIESDTEINPDGSKVDPNKLLKFVLDNDLVDSKGRWNYRAGFRMMKANGNTTPQNNNKDRKEIAGATTSESKAESKPKNYMTGADFKGGNRPW